MLNPQSPLPISSHESKDKIYEMEKRAMHYKLASQRETLLDHTHPIPTSIVNIRCLCKWATG